MSLPVKIAHYNGLNISYKLHLLRLSESIFTRKLHTSHLSYRNSSVSNTPIEHKNSRQNPFISTHWNNTRTCHTCESILSTGTWPFYRLRERACETSYSSIKINVNQVHERNSSQEISVRRIDAALTCLRKHIGQTVEKRRRRYTREV